QDLEKWRAGEAVSAWREPLMVTGRRWLGRNATLVAAGSVGGGAAAPLCGVTAFFLGANAGGRAAREGEAAGERIAEIQSEENKKRLDIAARDFYFDRISRADREWWSNHDERAEQLLDECAADLRQWEWYHLKRRCRGGLFSLKGHTAEVWAVAFSP